jgi:NADPH:quinone reductase-like Zn-dependent oxidoreductase
VLVLGLLYVMDQHRLLRLNAVKHHKGTTVSRASEDLLALLHGMVGSELLDQLRSEDPRTRISAVDRAMKFLKDNNITSTVEASVPLQDIQAAMPTAAELERLMQLTPD